MHLEKRKNEKRQNPGTHNDTPPTFMFHLRSCLCADFYDVFDCPLQPSILHRNCLCRAIGIFRTVIFDAIQAEVWPQRRSNVTSLPWLLLLTR